MAREVTRGNLLWTVISTCNKCILGVEPKDRVHLSTVSLCFDDNFESVNSDKNFSTIWAEKAGLMLREDFSENEYGRQVPDEFKRPFVSEVNNQETREAMMNDQVTDNIEVQEQDQQSQHQTENEEGMTETEEVSNSINPNENQDSTRTGEYRTRYGRIVRKPVCLIHIAICVAIIVCNLIEPMTTLEDGTLNSVPELFAYPASVAKKDTMYIKKSMQQDDRNEFLKAMVKEIEDHTVRGHWRIAPREEIEHRNYKHKPTMAIWSFNRKRNPMGDIIKYKARLCCHGGQTLKGVHYDESYSPIVSWSTIRMMLIMSIVHK